MFDRFTDRARRTLTLDPAIGEAAIHDKFEFAGDALPIEEAFVTWHDVTVQDDTVTIRYRDSRRQERIKVADALDVVREALLSSSGASPA